MTVFMILFFLYFWKITALTVETLPNIFLFFFIFSDTNKFKPERSVLLNEVFYEQHGMV